MSQSIVTSDAGINKLVIPAINIMANSTNVSTATVTDLLEATLEDVVQQLKHQIYCKKNFLDTITLANPKLNFISINASYR